MDGPPDAAKGTLPVCLHGDPGSACHIGHSRCTTAGTLIHEGMAGCHAGKSEEEGKKEEKAGKEEEGKRGKGRRGVDENG